MSKLALDISVSLDGYVAGPGQDVEHPLGVGGEQLHEWAFGLSSWREAHGKDGGEANVDSDVMAEMTEIIGATIMGRGMFGGGPGRWARARKPGTARGGARGRRRAGHQAEDLSEVNRGKAAPAWLLSPSSSPRPFRRP